MLQRQLQNRGILTTVANHGGEAITLLTSSSYHSLAPASAPDLGVVLMDKEMPIMDGLACTSTIRAMERRGGLKRHVPIIAVTANARQEQIRALLDAGMDDVVSKPFRIGELVPKIEELAGRYCGVVGEGEGAGAFKVPGKSGEGRLEAKGKGSEARYKGLGKG